MRCLFLHCRSFHYELDHPTKVADAAVDTHSASFEDALVVFISVENTDKEDKVNMAAKEIRKLARRSGAKKIVINPFSHLSQLLAPADLALKIFGLLLERLRTTSELDVAYTSFGWYKKFTVDVYGHDDSQVFREF